MPVLKPIRHEQVLRHYIKCGVGTEAYLRVYPHVGPRSAAMAASRLLTKPHVKKRHQELLAQMAKRADITEDKILTDYQRAMSREDAKPADIIAAATAQAKLVGLLRERIETGKPGDFENMENISDVIEAVRSQAGDDAANALMKAFGLEQTEITPTEPSNELIEAGLVDAKPASDAVN